MQIINKARNTLYKGQKNPEIKVSLQISLQWQGVGKI